MSQVLLEPAELRRRGFESLVAALGWANAVRFVQQYEPSTHNYTAERDEILADVDAAALARLATQASEARKGRE
jgi:hypothetical protein